MIEYYKNEKHIFLKGNVPSSKNSKQFISGVTKDGKKYTSIIPSKTVRNYLKEYEYQFMEHKVDLHNLFKGHNPAFLGLYFIRDSRHRFDYNNASQIITDMLVNHSIFDDDNADTIIPVFLGYEYNKEIPGVMIFNCFDIISKRYIVRAIRNELSNVDERNVYEILAYDNIIKLINQL